MPGQSTSADPADSTKQIQATEAPKIEQARARVKSALHAAEEDGCMDAATFGSIARPLVLALRDLDELTTF